MLTEDNQLFPSKNDGAWHLQKNLVLLVLRIKLFSINSWDSEFLPEAPLPNLLRIWSKNMILSV